MDGIDKKKVGSVGFMYNGFLGLSVWVFGV